MLVMVAKMIALMSFVGPSHAAMSGGKPAPSEFLIASPATTGTSTSRPRAMISVAMEICWRSIPSMCDIPKVIKRVIGIANPISSAERQSQKPISETITTRMIAS